MAQNNTAPDLMKLLSGAQGIFGMAKDMGIDFFGSEEEPKGKEFKDGPEEYEEVCRLLYGTDIILHDGSYATTQGMRPVDGQPGMMEVFLKGHMPMVLPLNAKVRVG